MREAHYTHGWLPAFLPADARRYRVSDETLAEVLASLGAGLVDEEPEVEISADPNAMRGDAPLALVPLDPTPRIAGGTVGRGARRLADSLAVRARARMAERVLRHLGFETTVRLWDIRGRIDLPTVPVERPRLAERLPRRGVVLGRRGEALPTALEAVLAEAGKAAGEEVRPEWASIRAGMLLVGGASTILRVAIGEARSQILDQVAALTALERAAYPPDVAERVPWMIAHGRAGLADWSLERRLPGARPPRAPGPELLDECVRFLVGLRQARGDEAERSFSTLVEGPAGVSRPGTAALLRELAGELDGVLAGLPRGFAHGDFFAGNLLAENGRLTAVLDWDAGGPGRVPGLDLLHFQLTRQPYGGDDDWGRAVVERLLPSARAGGDELLKRYCSEIGIEADPRLLEALVFAYWLEYAAYQLRAHPDRRAQPAWIEGNIELVARAAAELTKKTPPRGRGSGRPTRTA